jgi:site-specific DNA-methyltransferase (adenine-specific)
MSSSSSAENFLTLSDMLTSQKNTLTIVFAVLGCVKKIEHVVQFTTHGVPQDIHAARDLASRGKYHEFEKWALSLIAAQPGNFGRKGADRGLDGRLYFGAKGTTLGIVSVKAGENVGVSMIRDLKGVIERERAGVGVFLTLTEPTKPMVAEAASAGLHEELGFAPVPVCRS